MFNTLVGKTKFGGVGGGSSATNDVQYFSFTSPGNVDLSPYSYIARVDIFSVGAGNNGSTGASGTTSPHSGGAGGNGGTSGEVSVYLNAPGYTPTSPFPITIGTTQPLIVDGPQPAVDSPLTIPSSISSVFTGYSITAYGQSPRTGQRPSSGLAPSYQGSPGRGGAGGIHFAPTGEPTSTHPVLPSVTGNRGGQGGGYPPFRPGGPGGHGGEGYGAGGGGGGGGSELDGNTQGGAGGGSGAPGMVIVRVEYAPSSPSATSGSSFNPALAVAAESFRITDGPASGTVVDLGPGTGYEFASGYTHEFINYSPAPYNVTVEIVGAGGKGGRGGDGGDTGPQSTPGSPGTNGTPSFLNGPNISTVTAGGGSGGRGGNGTDSGGGSGNPGSGGIASNGDTNTNGNTGAGAPGGSDAPGYTGSGGASVYPTGTYGAGSGGGGGSGLANSPSAPPNGGNGGGGGGGGGSGAYASKTFEFIRGQSYFIQVANPPATPAGYGKIVKV